MDEEEVNWDDLRYFLGAVQEAAPRMSGQHPVP
jgi:hypothetical protein